MKSFKELSRTKKIITLAAGMLAVGSMVFSGQDEEYSPTGGYPATESADYSENYPTNYGESMNTSQTNSSYTQSVDPGKGQKVEIFDQGLQMPVSTLVLPEGWRVEQDIAFDPNTARPIKYKLDMTGPRGELSRGFSQLFMHGGLSGKRFEDVYQEALSVALRGTLAQPTVGNLVPSPKTEQHASFRKVAQQLQQQGQHVRAYEVEVSGQRSGQPYRGNIIFLRLTQSSAAGEIGVLQLLGLGIAPAAHYEEFMAISEKITESTVANPAHEQRLSQINQRVMQQMAANHQQRMSSAQAAHQQRMANRQAAFNAHQQNMAEMSQIQDASYNNYMNGLRNDNSSAWSNSNSYTGHNAYIDGIHERSTFENPDTGYDISLDGDYKYNYTDGLGNYHRTDDPSFDPASMPGNWYQVDPRSPNY